MESRSVSIAWKIMMIPNFAIWLFGLLFTFVPDAMNSLGFESMTGQSWSAFVSANPKIADYILLTDGRIAGVHLLAIAILSLAITLTSFRKGERWSWYALLITLTLMITFETVALLIMGQASVAIINVVLLLIVYLALGISAKDILRKK